MQRNSDLRRTSFGKCPITGNNGGEVASDSASSSTNLNADGNGIQLIKFRGKYISHQARDNILANEESIRDSKRHLRSEKFRRKLGYRNSI